MNIGYICILKLLPNIPLNVFLLLEGTIIKKKLLSYNLMMIIIIIICIIVHISVMINV